MPFLGGLGLQERAARPSQGLQRRWDEVSGGAVKRITICRVRLKMEMVGRTLPRVSRRHTREGLTGTASVAGEAELLPYG